MRKRFRCVAHPTRAWFPQLRLQLAHRNAQMGTFLQFLADWDPIMPHVWLHSCRSYRSRATNGRCMSLIEHPIGHPWLRIDRRQNVLVCPYVGRSYFGVTKAEEPPGIHLSLTNCWTLTFTLTGHILLHGAEIFIRSRQSFNLSRNWPIFTKPEGSLPAS
jgi:hypothetical protein